MLSIVFMLFSFGFIGMSIAVAYYATTSKRCTLKDAYKKGYNDAIKDSAPFI